MRILTLFVAAIAALALTGAVVAQHGGDVADHFAQVAKLLHLTPSQEKILKSEHDSAHAKLAAIDADPKLDATAKDKARAKVHTEMMAKAKSVLNPEQMKSLATIMQSAGHQQEMMQMMDKLGLDAKQKASVHEIFSTAMAEMGAIQGNASLTDAQKQAKAEQLHAETMQKIHAILTPEQIEKAKAMHHSGGHGIPPK